MNQRTRQRQKTTRRMILIIMASCTTCIVIGLAIFFHLSRVDKSVAAPKEIFISEQAFTTEMTLPATFIASSNNNGNGNPVQLIRKAKEIHSEKPVSN